MPIGRRPRSLQAENMKNDIEPPFAAAVRHALSHRQDVEEKWIFSGLWFLVDEKLCIWVREHEVLFRIDPALHDTALEKTGARELRRGGRPARGYVYVEVSALQRRTQLDPWIQWALEFNPRAKTSKPRAGRRRTRAA